MYRMNIIWLMASFWMLAFQFFHRNIADGVACMYETAISTPSKYTLHFVCINRHTHTSKHSHTYTERDRDTFMRMTLWRKYLYHFPLFAKRRSYLFISFWHSLFWLDCAIENVVSVAFIRIEQCAIRHSTILFNTVQSVPSHLVLKSSEYDGVLESPPTKIDVKHKFLSTSSPDHHASA